MSPLPHVTCPVCGNLNGCVPAARGDFAMRCWCETVVVVADVVAALSPEQRGASCVCAACAQGGGATSSGNGLIAPSA